MKILVIDDDKGSLLAFETAINILGHEYEGTSDPVDALIKYQEKTFDIVITDVCMPIIQGFGLADAIRKLNSAAKIIFVSGYLDESKKNMAYSLGSYLRKPIEINELRAVLSGLVHEDG